MRRRLWRIVQAFLFRIDAEKAHRLTLFLIRMGIAFGSRPLRWVSGTASRSGAKATERGLGGPRKLLGLEFESPIGLAAGFDKDAEILLGLPSLGFGFAEIGTVTPRPQPGNDRPRLFRDVSRSAIFNRMGFNGLGASIVSQRLREAKPLLPPGFRVGVNLGKNKETPNENAAEDYVRAARPFEGLADYLVVNVSSPNTPGLRALQSVESLRPILAALQELISRWQFVPPIFLKLAPEIEGENLQSLILDLEGCGVDGFILTNTLSGVWGESRLPGGWSGSVLSDRSRQSLRVARQTTSKPIISVGGIMDEVEAQRRLQEGADLIQLYSGWVFQGPDFPVRIKGALRNAGLELQKTQKP